MKKIIIFATVAFSCCGIRSSLAQIELSPTLPPRVAQAEIDGSGDIADPFDFAPAASPTSVQPVSPAAPSDPRSLPTSSNPDGIVDTIVNYSTLSNTPHVANTPIDWTSAPKTPNPVADVLLRQYCVEGLWDGYSAERAAECARMWEKIYGHSRQSCCQQVGGPCSVCSDNVSCGPKILNRYLQRGNCGASSSACDAGCNQCANNTAAQAPHYVHAQPTVPQQLPASTVQQTPVRRNVAALPPATVR